MSNHAKKPSELDLLRSTRTRKQVEDMEGEIRQLLRALRTIARGEVSGFELQQIAIRTLTEFNEFNAPGPDYKDA